ncbi:bifunctional phosphopantothenoylcysteine decarboxylase/phosphopantothenate--cysteine ligase CoaBC [Methanimicrococcus blatticola]|uniref:Coenzyme A biosynthesis bifunctional protein CoaBC n=1 Tax=Methanimicrococcus blatticola TaxID=91560 RepID=A0A484F2Y4_9EURY|nr:bifunctional phosphopantothenoylcysteine decarboxylase/phosphopantothenate--cysteine ligase CoaBC [Methanimicrococcus blatticola]MBZ3936089.1 bifunctional phosphopantothenoylcysteine decarboxylase/phosphopantothenate--cysteine ligase CoaBC [Methanimicrococcus blatticola]MCC2509302.1 bifunctional phosphopantothenoylcysteine decarboxylase/phosphopantothenate--cysteine ligase CoaBC [Methanimicrococcus blatticola]TDQ68189.1 phosphopantothenate-cysteine ligase /phosphopantothenoylcysteine decarbox
MENNQKFDSGDFISEEKAAASPVHPTLWIQEAKGTVLSGKTIVIGVTGSIAAVETVKLARELIRYGATVYAVMTDAARQIIHEDALHYATGNPVMTKLTGRVEHVEFFGSKGAADLFLIAPATANTISKIAAGIDDTPVTTFATTAIGEGKKVMIVPAMHESMYRHPKVLENLKTLESWGIDIIGPRVEEGIAKIAGNDEIVLRVLRELGDHSLSGKTVFVTSGSTAESIDPIRLLTNRASGKTGDALAKEAYIRGAEVYLFHRGKSSWGHLPHFHDIHTESVQEMIEAVTEKIALADIPLSGKNILISAAAISDYTVEAADSKIKSGERELTIKLKPTKKLIEEACYTDPNIFIVGFKAETDVSYQELINSAASKIDAGIADVVVANDVKEKGMGTNENDVYVVTKDYLINHDLKTVVPISGNKEKIAAELFDLICVEADSDAPQVFIDLEIRTTEPDDETERTDHEETNHDETDHEEPVLNMLEDTIDDHILNEEIDNSDSSSTLLAPSDAPISSNSDASGSKKTLRRKPAQMRGRIFKRN